MQGSSDCAPSLYSGAPMWIPYGRRGFRRAGAVGSHIPDGLRLQIRDHANSLWRIVFLQLEEIGNG